MTVVVNSLTCGSGMGIFWTARRVIRGLACGSGWWWPGPAGATKKCRSNENVQVWRKCAGCAGAAGGAGRILRGVGVLAGLALLAACAGRGEPRVQYVRVEVPVQVPCRVPEVAVPPWAAAGLCRSDSLEVKVRALLAERRQRIGYEKKLEAAISSCD